MITYTEKGSGLHEVIRKAGYSLREENGAFVSDNDTAVQSLIDAYSIAQAQAYISVNVNALTEAKFNKAIVGTSAAEMAGWSILRAEQIKYEASGLLTDCPSIVFEAAVRGLTVPELAAKVKINSIQFDQLRALIAGTSGKHRDAIKQLSTFEGISGYDFTTGWPL